MPISLQRNAVLFAALVMASTLASLPASALTPSKKAVEPVIVKNATGTVEVGTLEDAPYRIDIPVHWNRGLVVFYHGYALQPYTYRITDRINGQAEPFFDRGYAVIESGYSQTGWALAQAYPETEALRHYFIKKYGQPRDTYAAGGSMGGELVSITMELNPKPYMGGLDLCGAVGPTFLAFEHRFAMRAAFDHYFPGVMPPLVPVPNDFEDNDADRKKVLTALQSKPAAAAMLRNLTGLHTDAELAHDIAYYTFVVGDLQRRAGGNPFDNRNYLYSGTSTSGSAADMELNDHVSRYAADPKAFEYLAHHYTSTGRLGRPMLALHTVYDPIVQTFMLPIYFEQVQAAGTQNLFVQQYVDAEGHCNFTEDQIGLAFDELVRWSHGGPKPPSGLLKEQEVGNRK
jgi:hypothetical protein